MLDSKVYNTEVIDSWEKLIRWYDSTTTLGEQWVFRGVKDSQWGFVTSLERALKSFGIDPGQYSVSEIEGGLIKRFIRQSHHYLAHLPEEENVLEWLALMQHYGAPTRLLDWTHSMFAALFFAVEQAEQECAIWALNHHWLNQTAISMLPDDGRQAYDLDRNIRKRDTFNRIFLRQPPVSLIFSVKPYRFNDRLVIQQGTFLCSGDISIPFEDNMTATLSQPNAQGKLVKLTINNSAALRKDILKNLNRMNMNAATLFPGLAGFAQSLRTLLATPEILKP
jgi:hypothetical protein